MSTETPYPITNPVSGVIVFLPLACTLAIPIGGAVHYGLGVLYTPLVILGLLPALAATWILASRPPGALEFGCFSFPFLASTPMWFQAFDSLSKARARGLREQGWPAEAAALESWEFFNFAASASSAALAASVVCWLWLLSFNSCPPPVATPDDGRPPNVPPADRETTS